MGRQKGVMQKLDEPADCGGQGFGVEVDKFETTMFPEFMHLLWRNGLGFIRPLEKLSKVVVQLGRNGGRDGQHTTDVRQERFQ